MTRFETKKKLKVLRKTEEHYLDLWHQASWSFVTHVDRWYEHEVFAFWYDEWLGIKDEIAKLEKSLTK